MDVPLIAHAAVMAAFPDLQLTIESQVAEDDKVVMRWTGRGRHEGEFQGVAPTGKEVTITGITISRIEGDREIEDWEEVNMLGLTIIHLLNLSKKELGEKIPRV